MRLILIIFLFFSIYSYSQDVIKIEKQGGVYTIPCKLNGLPLKFIFDTGASDVSISLTEALFMLKNGYLKESDIKGTVYYSIANGEISEGTKINLFKIEVGRQVLYNVEASIIHTSEAPLLFGQSAMERFGKFTLDYANSNLIIVTSRDNNLGAFVDKRDNKTYKTTVIGTQTWMAENLRFNTKEGCYPPNGNIKNVAKYGYLYAVGSTSNACPTGWHLPSMVEFEILINYLGGDDKIVEEIKSTNFWKISDSAVIGKNNTGFNALPAGFFYDGTMYEGALEYEEFSSTTYWYTDLMYKYGKRPIIVGINNCENKIVKGTVSRYNGASIRCLKD